MNAKNTWFWLFLAAGLFAVIFFFHRPSGPAVSGPAKILPGLKAAAITSVQVRPAGKVEIRAERAHGAWEADRAAGLSGTVRRHR